MLYHFVAHANDFDAKCELDRILFTLMPVYPDALPTTFERFIIATNVGWTESEGQPPGHDVAANKREASSQRTSAEIAQPLSTNLELFALAAC